MEKITATQRKWLLSAHIMFGAITFGVAIVFLILSLTAASTHDQSVLQACYYSMHVLSKTAVRYSTIFTLLTGVLLSVWTRRGLFKFYWIIAKEGLTIVSIVLGPIGMYLWTLKAVTLITANGLSAVQDPAFIVNSRQLWIGIILQIISLAATYAISVFKPWGPRKQKHRPNLA